MADPLRAARDRAKALGFAAFGVTSVDQVRAAGLHLIEAVQLGRHASMAWMAVNSRPLVRKWTRVRDRCDPAIDWA